MSRNVAGGWALNCQYQGNSLIDAAFISGIWITSENGGYRSESVISSPTNQWAIEIHVAS